MFKSNLFHEKDENLIVVDQEPVVTDIENDLATYGISSCVMVALLGRTKAGLRFGMGHILADLSELDALLEKFVMIKTILVIGGTEEWYSKPLFLSITEQLSNIPNAKLTTVFNPIESDTNQVADIFVSVVDDDLVYKTIIRPYELAPGNLVFKLV